VARDILGGIEREMAAVHLERSKRTVIYNLGAAECLLLDEVNPDWRKRYFQEMFSLDQYFPVAK
jgi:hypothetical protein